MRQQRNDDLLKQIREVHAELTLGRGEVVNRKRVERLMRQAGIQWIHRRRGRKNLVNVATEEDLVKRAFTVDAPDMLWVTDITDHPAREGKLYCAAILHCFSGGSSGIPSGRVRTPSW
ncbi:IS3 family transposase [Actinomadura gamaensis]|uniref:IS3 family transposase n=1 Tax=Actinomadura gamaensis TaxID=1763541 RepID=A0ABV9UFS2_9ACTN